MKDEAFLIFDAQTQSTERVDGESELTTRVEQILFGKPYGYELRIFKQFPLSRLISVFAAEQNLIRNGVKPTYENIGKLLGVTRQRVEQLYKASGQGAPSLKKRKIDEDKLRKHFDSFETSKFSCKELIDTVKFQAEKSLIKVVLNDFPKTDKRCGCRDPFILAILQSGLDTKSLTAGEIANQTGFTDHSNPSKALIYHKIPYKKKKSTIKTKGGI